MSTCGLAGGLYGGLSAEGTGPGETPKATALEAPSTHMGRGGMPADEAGGFAAEKLSPAAGGLAAEVDPHRPNGGVTAGAEESGGLPTVVPAGGAPIAALLPMPLDGCAPPAGGGLSAVA